MSKKWEIQLIGPMKMSNLNYVCVKLIEINTVRWLTHFWISFRSILISNSIKFVVKVNHYIIYGSLEIHIPYDLLWKRHVP